VLYLPCLGEAVAEDGHLGGKEREENLGGGTFLSPYHLTLPRHFASQNTTVGWICAPASIIQPQAYDESIYFLLSNSSQSLALGRLGR
jgi:hypothetical protein